MVRKPEDFAPKKIKSKEGSGYEDFVEYINETPAPEPEIMTLKNIIVNKQKKADKKVHPKTVTKLLKKKKKGGK